MKRIVRTEIIPEKIIPSCEIEVVEFVCDADGCDFKTKREGDADKHFGENHAAKEYKKVGDHNFYYFESEENARAWINTYTLYDVRYVDWIGEGWYGSESGDQLCPKNCCTDLYIRLQHYSTFLNGWEEQSKELKSDIKKFEELIDKPI